MDVTTLNHLSKEADDLAAFYLSPYTYTRSQSGMLSFGADGEVTVDIKKAGSYLLTSWARTQLNTLMGTRDKWFDFVDSQTEADERIKRIEVLEDKRLLLSRGPEEDDPGLVRGIVSRGYKDIPYTFIMKCLFDCLPAAGASEFSTKWSFIDYKYLHVLHVSSEVLSLPGSKVEWRPGILIRTSEVGASSVNIYPALALGRALTPVVFKDGKHAFRRIHSGGKDNELKEAFEEGIYNASQFFRDPKGLRIMRLKEIEYEDVDAGIKEIQRACDTVGLTKRFLDDLSTRYQEVVGKGAINTAVTILLCIQQMANEYLNTDQDLALKMPEWTGALLFQLQR